MEQLINVTLLTLGFAGALAAFGGDTWKKGKKPIRQRITTRGWVSIISLSLTLLLGIVKEVRNSRETNDLVSEIGRLRTQLQRQQAIVDAKRLEEIREQDAKVAAFEQRVSKVSGVYERFRDASIKVEGRSRRIDGPVPPALGFVFSADNFEINVCADRFARVAARTFQISTCENANLMTLFDRLPSTDFERGDLGPSAITLLAYLSEISVAHRDALNGPVSIGSRDEAMQSLETVLNNSPHECQLEPAFVANLAAKAKVLRNIETSAQQLHWLFEFGLPASDPSNTEWLDGQLEGSSAELLMQMSQIERIFANSERPPDTKTYTVGAFVKNVAGAYRDVTGGVAEVRKRCQRQRAAYAGEMKQIESQRNGPQGAW